MKYGLQRRIYSIFVKDILLFLLPKDLPMAAEIPNFHPNLQMPNSNTQQMQYLNTGLVM